MIKFRRLTRCCINFIQLAIGSMQRGAAPWRHGQMTINQRGWDTGYQHELSSQSDQCLHSLFCLYSRSPPKDEDTQNWLMGFISWNDDSASLKRDNERCLGITHERLTAEGEERSPAAAARLLYWNKQGLDIKFYFRRILQAPPFTLESHWWYLPRENIPIWKVPKYQIDTFTSSIF